MVSKGRHNGGLNKLIIPDRDNPGQRKECHQKREIEEAPLQHNENECLQTHNAPPLTQPLVSELGIKGDGPEAENILKGECTLVDEVDDETAVLVRNKRSGQLRLVTEKVLFVPSNDEEVAKVQKLIKLASYEACIVRDKTGKDMFYFGSNEDQRSFFLPPHSQLVELLWSRGRRREYRDLRITKLDLRPMYMSFEFNCRTNDNVELVLEGSFFWQVVDVK